MRAAVGDDTEVPSGRLMVRGDNPHSLDSRHFGYIGADSFRGVAVRRLSGAVRPPEEHQYLRT
jgi:signal peptidase I